MGGETTDPTQSTNRKNTIPNRASQYPLLDTAIRQGRASFELLVQVLYDMHNDKSQHDENYREMCPAVVRAFERSNGRIAQRDIRADIRAAVILTERSKLYLDYSIGSCPSVDPYLVECHQMAVETERLLGGSAKRACLEMNYAIAKNLFCLVERFSWEQQKENGKDLKQVETEIAETLTVIEQRVEMMKTYHMRASQLRAQRYYLLGALIGFSLLVALLVLPSMGIEWTNLLPAFPAQLLGSSLICGSIGAMISVMMRMGRGNLELDCEARNWLLLVTGIFRPVVGAVFAVVLVALLKSSILPFNVGDSVLATYVIGFLAGFSERFAPDMLDLSRRQMGETNKM